MTPSPTPHPSSTGSEKEPALIRFLILTILGIINRSTESHTSRPVPTVYPYLRPCPRLCILESSHRASCVKSELFTTTPPAFQSMPTLNGDPVWILSCSFELRSATLLSKNDGHEIVFPDVLTMPVVSFTTLLRRSPLTQHPDRSSCPRFGPPALGSTACIKDDSRVLWLHGFRLLCEPWQQDRGKLVLVNDTERWVFAIHSHPYDIIDLDCCIEPWGRHRWLIGRWNVRRA